MTTQLTFDEYPHREYPHRPGFKKAGTSSEAAELIGKAAPTLRGKVLAWLKSLPMTPDELANAMREDVLSIRPRCSELIRMGLVRETGERRKSSRGRSQAVLTAI